MSAELRDFQRAANTLEAGRVVRYHAVPTVQGQSVGLHSWGVLILCLYVTGGEASRELLIMAAMHDTPEIYSGDAPFTAKRDNPELKKVHTMLEERAYRIFVMPDVGLNEHDAAVLKMCDTIEGLLWCRKTELTGPVRERWREALNVAFVKFAPVLSKEEIDRAVVLVNEENFWPTL